MSGAGIVVALLAVLLLVACGGGGGDELPGAGPLRVVLYGDSTTVGWDGAGTGKPVAVPPDVLLQRALESRFGRGRVEVVNRGVVGAASGDPLASPDWPAEGDLIVIAYGINDARLGVPVGTYADNLRRMQLTAGAPVVFQTPTPTYERPWTVDAYVLAMRNEAAWLGVPVADAYAAVIALPGWKDVIQDGVHPNQAGYSMIATDVLAPVVMDALQRAGAAR